jgi:hypothetical protein
MTAGLQHALARITAGIGAALIIGALFITWFTFHFRFGTQPDEAVALTGWNAESWIDIALSALAVLAGGVAIASLWVQKRVLFFLDAAVLLAVGLTAYRLVSVPGAKNALGLKFGEGTGLLQTLGVHESASRGAGPVMALGGGMLLSLAAVWLHVLPRISTKKTCVDCLSRVPAQARVCAQCGHRFEAAAAPA